MKASLELLMEAAKRIRGAVMPLAGSEEGSKVVGVGAGGDKTKYIDVAAESSLFSFLEEIGANYVVISEESGVRKFGDGSSGYLIVDPLDGSENAARGIPFFATSLAISKGPMLSDVCVGLVMDLFTGASYWAIKGEGAWSSHGPLRPSSASRLRDSIISAGLSLAGEATPRSIIGLFSAVSKVRHLGANALEICYVASGRLDAYVNVWRGLRVVDFAAACLILREAGGCVISPGGEDLDAPIGPGERARFIAASNRRLAEELAKAIGGR